MTEKEGVFVRKSSGLVRAFSPIDAFLYNCSSTIISLAVAGSISMAVFADPGASVTGGVLITLILASFMALTFSFMSIIMPRSGGEYIYISRTLHPALGFATSWIMNIIWLFYLGMDTWFIATPLYAYVTMLGVQTNNAGMESAASALSNSTVIFIVGAIILLVMMIVPIMGMRRYAHLQLVLSVVGFIGTAVTLVIIATASQSSFISNFNSVANHFAPQISDPYHYIITTASNTGFAMPGESLEQTVRSIPAWFWSLSFAIIGTQYIGGEIKQARKSQQVATIGCLFVTGIMIALTEVITNLMVGKTFYYSLYYLYHTGGGNLGSLGSFDPNYTFIADVLTHNVVLQVLVAAGFISFFLLGLSMIMILFSRCLFAWSFDGLVPKMFADVNPKYKVPVKGLIVAWIVGVVCLYFWVQYASVFFSMGVTLIEAIVWGTTGVAAIVLPIKNKEMLEASPVNYKIGGVSLLTIAGIVTLFLNAMMVAFIAFLPEWAVAAAPTIVPLVVLYFSGFVIFYVARAYRRRRGIDVGLAYKELPPE